jgi:hypothetical protein
MVLVVTSRYVRLLPGVVMPFIAADEDGRDTVVCKSSNRASSNRAYKLLHSCYLSLYGAFYAKTNDDSFVILIILPADF